MFVISGLLILQLPEGDTAHLLCRKQTLLRRLATHDALTGV